MFCRKVSNFFLGVVELRINIVNLFGVGVESFEMSYEEVSIVTLSGYFQEFPNLEFVYVKHKDFVRLITIVPE